MKISITQRIKYLGEGKSYMYRYIATNMSPKKNMMPKKLLVTCIYSVQKTDNIFINSVFFCGAELSESFKNACSSGSEVFFCFALLKTIW
jgi:hypothetical protein